MVTEIEKVVRDLPPELQREVQDFAEFLRAKTGAKRNGRKRRRMRLDWAGGLKEYRNQFTSIELQKKSLEWWGT